MAGDGVISCAYRLFGRLPTEAHSDLPMKSHDTITQITRGVTGACGNIKVNLLLSFSLVSILITICVRSCLYCSTDRRRGRLWWWSSAMQETGEGVCMCGGREHMQR